jgi:hypothetical protein
MEAYTLDKRILEALDPRAHVEKEAVPALDIAI